MSTSDQTSASDSWKNDPNQAILVVDDSEPMRSLTSCLIMECGIEHVDTADGGDSARTLLSEKNYPVMFLDIEMPDVNGIELLKEIKQQKPDTYIVMLSGHSSPDNVKESLSNGANGFIMKPCSIQKINESLENYAKKSGL